MNFPHDFSAFQSGPRGVSDAVQRCVQSGPRSSRFCLRSSLRASSTVNSLPHWRHARSRGRADQSQSPLAPKTIRAQRDISLTSISPFVGFGPASSPSARGACPVAGVKHVKNFKLSFFFTFTNRDVSTTGISPWYWNRQLVNKVKLISAFWCFHVLLDRWRGFTFH